MSQGSYDILSVLVLICGGIGVLLFIYPYTDYVAMERCGIVTFLIFISIKVEAIFKKLHKDDE